MATGPAWPWTDFARFAQLAPFKLTHRADADGEVVAGRLVLAIGALDGMAGEAHEHAAAVAPPG